MTGSGGCGRKGNVKVDRGVNRKQRGKNGNPNGGYVYVSGGKVSQAANICVLQDLYIGTFKFKTGLVAGSND